jgi:hypothetical protein
VQLIDDQGRLFGRLNIVDAAGVLVVGVLIPLVYGAYMLFRPELPRLTAVEPSTVEQGTVQVNVRGEHLRPELRLTVDGRAVRLLLADSEHGILQIPVLEPGSYDVAVLDDSQELGRLSGALTVVAPATTIAEIVAIGSFDAADLAQAETLRRTVEADGQDAGRAWDVLEVKPPEPEYVYLPPHRIPLSSGRYQVRAVLRFRCALTQDIVTQTGLTPEKCSTFDVPLARDAVVRVPVGPGGEMDAPFRIIELHPVYTGVVDVALRATGCSVSPTDSPVPTASGPLTTASGYATPGESGYLTAEELSALREAARSGTRSSIEDTLAPSLESFDVLAETSNRELVVTVHLRVPAVNTAAGWMHRGSFLRAGGAFMVAGRSYQLCGRIIDVGPATPLN